MTQQWCFANLSTGFVSLRAGQDGPGLAGPAPGPDGTPPGHSLGYSRTSPSRWRLSMCAHARLAKAKSRSTVLHVGRISENSFITVAMRQNDWRTESRACRLGRRRGPGGTRIQNGTEITESRRYLVGQGARHPTAFATHTTMTQHNDAIQWPLSDWPLAGQTLAT